KGCHQRLLGFQRKIVDRAFPISPARSAGRTGPLRRLEEIQRRYAPAAPDRLAPSRSAERPATRQRPRSDAEIAFGGEVSWRSLLWGSRRWRAYVGARTHGR